MTTPTITSAELRAITGLTDRRHRQLADEGVIPKPTRGIFPLVETVKRLLEYNRQLGRRDNSALEAEKLRLTKEQADAQALKNAITRREVLPVPAVQAHLAAVLVALKASVLESNLLKEEKRDLLLELQRLGENVNVPDDDGDTQELTPPQ